MEKHAFPSTDRPGQQDNCMKGRSVKLNAIGEDDHGSQHDVRQTRALSRGPLALVFQEVRKHLEAHGLYPLYVGKCDRPVDNRVDGTGPWEVRVSRIAIH